MSGLSAGFAYRAVQLYHGRNSRAFKTTTDDVGETLVVVYAQDASTNRLFGSQSMNITITAAE